MWKYIILSLLILSPFLIQSSDAYLTIPPTRAFSIFNGSGGNVTANSYRDFATFVSGSGMAIAFDYTLHTITFNSTVSAGTLASIHQIGNVTETGCAVGQYLSVNSTGFFVCTTLSGSGETNTASNSGHGESLVLAKNVFDLPFKGIACGSLMTCSSNATDVILTGVGDGVGVNSLNFTTSSDFDFNFNTNASSLSLDGTVFNFRLGNNIVQTNNTAQTVTKSLTLNTLVLGGAANANSQLINSLGVPLATTDVQRVDKLGLQSVVTSPCTNLQYLSYQTSNSTWVCNTLPASSGFTNIVQMATGTATILNSNQSNTAEIKSLTQGTGITITNGSNTITIASSVVDTDTTKVNSSPQTTATIITDNSTSGVTLKTLTQGTGITLTNGSNAVTINSSITQGFTNITPSYTNQNATLIESNSSNSAVFKNISGSANIKVENTTNTLIIIYNGTSSGSGFTNIASELGTTNATLIADNSTVANRASFKTISSASSGLKVLNGTQSVILSLDTTASGGGAITNLAANVTGTLALGTDVLIWSIPLTANSGNEISGTIIASSATTGNAVQIAGNVTNLNTRGFCHYTSVATVTTDSIDNTVMNTVLTGRATNNAETLWIAAANVPQPISFVCSLIAGATAGNFKLWFTPEVTATANTVYAGSYYIKTP